MADFSINGHVASIIVALFSMHDRAGCCLKKKKIEKLKTTESIAHCSCLIFAIASTV